MRRALVLAVLVLVSGSACSGTPSSSSSTRGVWQKLHRPLHVGALAPGARCPVSPVDRRFRFAKYGVGLGIGPGPAYPVSKGAALRIEFPPPAATDFSTGAWGGQRVMWLVSSAYRGPLLVRGHRLDGRDAVRFDSGTVPRGELRIGVDDRGGWPVGVMSDDGQRYRRSYTRLRSPGCYAYQVDGLNFSYRVVFRAELGVESQPFK
jgi:hypothetical protein